MKIVYQIYAFDYNDRLDIQLYIELWPRIFIVFPFAATNRSVRFSNLSEVRQLSDVVAEDAKLARLSWSAYMRAQELKLKTASRLTVKQVLKASIAFCCIVSRGKGRGGGNVTFGRLVRLSLSTTEKREVG